MGEHARSAGARRGHETGQAGDEQWQVQRDRECNKFCLACKAACTLTDEVTVVRDL